ncbi:hypothetical protein, partial [Streptomyces corynorhini]
MPRHRIASHARGSAARRAVSPALTGLALLLVLALSAWVVTRAGSGRSVGAGALTGSSRAALVPPEPSATTSASVSASVSASASASASVSASSATARADQELSERLAAVLTSSGAAATASLQVAVLDVRDLADGSAPVRSGARSTG